MRPSQVMMEALFSQRNIHDVLHRSIDQQLDKMFLTWAIGCYVRIDEYLERYYYTAKGKPFDSKNIRIARLKELIAEKDLDHLIVAIVAAVIRGKRDQTIQQVLGYLESYMPHEDVFDRVKTAGELLAICGGEGRFFEIHRDSVEDSPQVICNHWGKVLETFHAQLAFIDDTFYNPPLVEKPKRVRSTRSCGYHTIQEPLILGRETMHDHNVSYDVVNRLNEIPWYLDSMVLTHPERPVTEDPDERDIANHVKHVGQAQRIYGVLGSDKFWVAWQYDSRGRIYSHGHHVNLQSHEYKKAMLNFGSEQVIST